MLKVGVIGSGYWGKHHLRIFSKLPCELVGIADIDPSKESLAKQYDVAFFQDYKKLLKKVDAVSIVTPASIHFELAKKCLRQGKHVLLEKPFVNSVKEAMIIKDLSAKNGCVVMSGHTYLYHPAIRQLKEYIDNGQVGKIYYLILQWLNLGIIRKDVNALWNFGPHPFSILHYLIGKLPVSIMCNGNAFVQQSVEDVVFATIDYGSGISVQVNMSWLHPVKVREVAVVGSKQLVYFNDTLVDAPLKLYDKGIEPEQFARFMNWETYAEFQTKTRYGTVEIPQFTETEPLKLELLDFIESIEQHKRPVSDIDSALAVVTMLQKTQESLRKKKQVLL